MGQSRTGGTRAAGAEQAPLPGQGVYLLAEHMERNGELARRLMAAYAKLRTNPCCTARPGSETAFTRR